MTQVIAVDLGAESGRVTRVDFDGDRLRLDEIHRFPNIPVQAGGTLYWDVLRLWREIVDRDREGRHRRGRDWRGCLGRRFRAAGSRWEAARQPGALSGSADGRDVRLGVRARASPRGVRAQRHPVYDHQHAVSTGEYGGDEQRTA